MDFNKELFPLWVDWLILIVMSIIGLKIILPLVFKNI